MVSAIGSCARLNAAGENANQGRSGETACRRRTELEDRIYLAILFDLRAERCYWRQLGTVAADRRAASRPGVDDGVLDTDGHLGTSPAAGEGWREIVGDPTIADAILDRLVRSAHRPILKKWRACASLAPGVRCLTPSPSNSLIRTPTPEQAHKGPRGSGERWNPKPAFIAPGDSIRWEGPVPTSSECGPRPSRATSISGLSPQRLASIGDVLLGNYASASALYRDRQTRN